MNSEEAFGVEEALRIADAAIFRRTGKRLTNVQAAILRGSFEQLTYEKIADRYDYTAAYLLQDAGPSFWRLLSQALGQGKIGKNNFLTVLQQQWQAEQSVLDGASLVQSDAPLHPEQPTSAAAASLTDWGNTNPQVDLGTAPNTLPFYGYSTALEQLEGWLTIDGCRLIIIFGLPGTGKSTLAAKLVQRIQGDFDFVIWRSLNDYRFRTRPPSIEELLSSVMQFLTAQPVMADVMQLPHCLINHRCLIVLDGLEAVLRHGAWDGLYQEAHEGYGEFLRQIRETASIQQSCVLVTSQEQFKDLANAEGTAIRSLELLGLEEDEGRAFFTEKGPFSGADIDLCLRVLVKRCAGNPRLLDRVSQIIRREFDGNLANFLQEVRQSSMWGIHDLLREEFERVSELERMVINILWRLTNSGEQATLHDILQSVVPAIPRVRLREVLQSLQRRSMIRSASGRYGLKTLVMEYVADQSL